MARQDVKRAQEAPSSTCQGRGFRQFNRFVERPKDMVLANLGSDRCAEASRPRGSGRSRAKAQSQAAQLGFDSGQLVESLICSS